MIRFLEISNHVLFWYYLASNFAYLVMLIVALRVTLDAGEATVIRLP